MAAIPLQRQTLPFHASAISVNNKLILISGESGAGKSTALTVLILRGYAVFSDDVVV
jgi:serine kinase of HPr protein (carbohydrate metabolism regulator)